MSFEQTYQTGEALALEGLPLGYSFRITAVSAAGAEGTIPSWRPVIGRRDRQTLVIQPRVRITGVVTDEADQPLPGSTITCYIAVNQAVRGTNSTETDIEGRFCLDFHGSGQTSLSVSKPGYQGRLEALGFLEAGQLLDNMRLTLHACPTVVGVVKEVAGPVVPGALVQYMDPRHLSAGIISSHADLNGRFSIPIRGEMPVLLWAFVAQPDPDTGLPQASAIMPLSKVPDDLMILVETPPGALTVTIRDDLGQPVFSCAVEARLVADPRSALLRRKLQTGDRSEFTLRGLVNGLWQVEVLREGYLQQEQRLSAIDGSSVSTEIVLERPGSLRGQVVNLGGVPVDHASTSLLSKGDHGGQHWRPVDTSQADWGDEGTFSFASLPPGIYKVTATDAGRGFGQSQSAILRAGENVELDPIVLEELGEIRGRVVDRTTGTGLAGIQIASMPLWDPGFPLPQITASSVGGAFEFPGLRPGLYRLEVLSDKGGEIPGGDPQDGIGSRWGRHSQNIEVTSGRISHAEMFLRDSWGVLLEGVIEEAARVADLHVQLHPLPTIEDPFHSFARDTISPQGYFRLRSSTAGWHLLAICSTLADSVYEERIYLHAGANSCTVRIPTGSVSGRVRLVGSRPEFAPHRVVVETQDAGMAFGRDDSARKRVRTDVDGNFVIRGLPDGRYLVRAGGQLDGANSTTGAVVLPNVVVEQGADTNLGEILLQPAGGIVGMVFDGHGYALAGAEILVWTAGGEVLQPSSWSDHNGRFRVRGVSPGNYAVAARTTDMCCAPEWITCGGGDSDEQVVLNLSESPVVTLRFRWPDESASTPPWAVLSVRSESGITWKPPGRSLAFQAIQKGQDNRGKIALGPMPPGLYTVDIRHSPRGGVTRQMVVEPGHADKVEVIEFE